MPHSIVSVLLAELALIVLTTLFLTQPKILFKSDSKPFLSFVEWSGMVFLCLTFCWSVVVGIVLSIHGLVFNV